MRWYILRALLGKEFQRHVANRGGIALGLLLVAAAILLSLFTPEDSSSGTGMVGGVHHCYVEFDVASPLIQHLQTHIPKEMEGRIRFDRLKDPQDVDGLVSYPPGTGSIQIRRTAEPGKRQSISVSIWHPKGDATGLAPYEVWFWREARRAFTESARKRLPEAAIPADPIFDEGSDWQIVEAHRRFQDRVEVLPGGALLVPDLSVDRKGLAGDVLDFRAAIATGMVVFALYFSCVYLLPTLNCEERERGVLLAQALSPASPAEILAAKFMFYPTLGIGLAAIIGGIYKPEVLSSLFFWMSLIAVGGGFLGIGMTVATLAKTQRAAFLGGMCYLLTISLLMLICSQSSHPIVIYIPYIAIEFHGPRVLHAALSGAIQTKHWYHLAATAGLALIWVMVAGRLFRTRGWQ